MILLPGLLAVFAPIPGCPAAEVVPVLREIEFDEPRRFRATVELVNCGARFDRDLALFVHFDRADDGGEALTLLRYPEPYLRPLSFPLPTSQWGPNEVTTVSAGPVTIPDDYEDDTLILVGLWDAGGSGQRFAMAGQDDGRLRYPVARLTCMDGVWSWERIIGEQREENIGVRPRGMVGRTRRHAATIDLSRIDPDDWEVVSDNGGFGSLRRSREHLCWGEAAARLGYWGEGPNTGVIFQPKEPILLPDEFDAVELWLKGGVVGWAPSAPEHPRVLPFLRLLDGEGKQHQFNLRPVNFPWWYAMFRELDVSGLPRPLRLQQLGIWGCTNTEEKALYVDSLCVFNRDFADKLDLPDVPPADWVTTPDTILPPTPQVRFRNTIKQEGDLFVFAYDGEDERLEWVVDPRPGTFDGISVRLPDEQRFAPCVGGGPIAEGLDRQLEDSALQSNALVARYARGLTWRCTIRGKSLIVELAGDAGVERVSLGRLEGADARVHRIPYLTFHDRPGAPQVGACAERLVTVLPCWYTSGASELWARLPEGRPDDPCLGGDIVYTPLPGGERNPLRERLVFTVSSRFADVLPAIPHAPTPFRDRLADRVHYHASARAADMQSDLARFRRLKRQGVEKLLVRHHDSPWADEAQGPQEWTLTTDAAPIIGDAALRTYLAEMEALDYHPVLYTNYGDLQPVSPEFDYDKVLRDADGTVRSRCWPGSYPIKPLAAIDLENRYAPQIHAKFGTRGSFCDIHTALTPWDRTDYDARTSGVASFQTCYRATARMLLNEKRNYEGPVISEGTCHMFYAGLADGNDAQIAYGRPWEWPWIVDFDLLRMHPLEIDAGMSWASRYLPPEEMGSVADPHGLGLNHYLAATIAFGHAGQLTTNGSGFPYSAAVRAYHLTQQLQQRYLMEPPSSIRYCNGAELVDTSQAILSGAVGRNQVRVSYANGLEVAVNGHPSEAWVATIGERAHELPPYGFAAGGPDITEYSATVQGHRADYVRSPEYLFFDAWGTTTDFGEAVSDGAGRLSLNDGELRLVVLGPYEAMQLRIDRLLPGAGEIQVLAEDEDAEDLREVETQARDGGLSLPADDPPFAFVVRRR